MLNNKKGIVLIASYIVIAVLTILGAAFVSRSISEMKIAEREKNSIQAFYIAEAGIDYALEELRDGVSSGQHGDDLNDSSGLIVGTYNSVWQRIGATSTWEITSSGFVGDTERRVHVELQPDTFARYLYFTDDEHYHWRWWRIPVWFVTGDALGGPLQTNSHFHVSGDPVFSDPSFHLPVKSEDSYITYMNGGRPINSTASSNPPRDNPDFQEGLRLGESRAPFPSKALDLRTAAVHDGLILTGPTTIVLRDDGSMDVTNPHQGLVNENMALPLNGALFVNGGDLTISGTLNGQLSVGTNRNIVIPDNIIYNNDPRVDPTSTDTLALIAERDTVISMGAPYDLEINASIMALGNSFTVENYWEGPAKGTLTVYGGIIQDERGPVGTFNASTNTKVSGYTKDYQYDTRLMTNPPPFYPTTGDYVIVSWEEE
ncbi:MAG: hypothetical protein KKG01_03045 [Candidatus Omnitrophica bacterium]|nr:hypothetical protein [Candidatus Omnitrophota bacterium]